jgi:hypothetical protein
MTTTLSPLVLSPILASYALISTTLAVATGTPGLTIVDGGLVNATTKTGGSISPPNTPTDITDLPASVNALVVALENEYPVGSRRTEITGGALGGITLNPGVYNVPAATYNLDVNTTLTLDGNGNIQSQFLLFFPETFITSGGTINLINGAQANNVFFIVGSSATLDSGTVFRGTILAKASISATGTASIITGRLLASLTVSFDNPTTITMPTVIIPCYAKGSKVLTSTGYRLIEDIRAGDFVVSEGRFPKGYRLDIGNNRTNQQVLFVGHFTPDSMTLDSRPIVIRQHALGIQLPFEDTRVSPEHCVLDHNKMYRARSLVNNSRIYQDMECESVEYYHILLNGHHLINVNGMQAESLNGYSFLNTFQTNTITIQATEEICV